MPPWQQRPPGLGGRVCRIADASLSRPKQQLHRGGARLRRAGWPRLVGAALTVLGIVWVGAGLLDVLRGALALL